MLHFNGDLSKVKFYQNTHGRMFVKLTDGTMIEGAIEYRLVFFACSCQRHRKRFSHLSLSLSPWQCQEQRAAIGSTHRNRTEQRVARLQRWSIRNMVSAVGSPHNSCSMPLDKNRMESRSLCSSPIFTEHPLAASAFFRSERVPLNFDSTRPATHVNRDYGPTPTIVMNSSITVFLSSVALTVMTKDETHTSRCICISVVVLYPSSPSFVRRAHLCRRWRSFPPCWVPMTRV